MKALFTRTRSGLWKPGHPPNETLLKKYGVIGYWKFGEDDNTSIFDYSNSKLNGSLPASGTSWTPGIRGRSLRLDGSAGYVNMGNNSIYAHDNDFTAVIRFRCHATPSTDHLMGFTLSNSSGWRIRLASDTTITALFDCTSDATGTWTVTSLGTGWHYLVVTWISKVATLYLDGRNYSTISGSGSAQSISTQNYAVGAQNAASLFAFIDIDEHIFARGGWKESFIWQIYTSPNYFYTPTKLFSFASGTLQTVVVDTNNIPITAGAESKVIRAANVVVGSHNVHIISGTHKAIPSSNIKVNSNSIPIVSGSHKLLPVAKIIAGTNNISIVSSNPSVKNWYQFIRVGENNIPIVSADPLLLQKLPPPPPGSEMYVLVGNPTQGGVDGERVSSNTEVYPIVSEVLDPWLEQESKPIKVALRMAPGKSSIGSTTLLFEGDTYLLWNVATDSSGQPGDWGGWGGSITISELITDTNHSFWVKAKAVMQDVEGKDTTVNLLVHYKV